MGTLYDLLGALPSDDAEELRTAFRKAAKATHPDINPDNPDAALRFRELVRAYDILTDADQRATYDQLLVIALKPPATQTARTYEAVRKVASNTMAATVISAVLVGGYTLFGHFSEPPVAAEIASDVMADGSLETATEASSDLAARVWRLGAVSAGGAAAPAVMPAAKEAIMGAIGRFEPVPAFATYNLGIQYYPRFTAAYSDRGVVLRRVGDFDGPFTTITPARRNREAKRAKIPTPVPRKPLAIVPPMPEDRTPVAAALTP